jgi:hypothetical protein
MATAVLRRPIKYLALRCHVARMLRCRCLGGGMTLPYTTWQTHKRHRVGGQWLLVQSAVCPPTLTSQARRGWPPVQAGHAVSRCSQACRRGLQPLPQHILGLIPQPSRELIARRTRHTPVAQTRQGHLKLVPGRGSGRVVKRRGPHAQQLGRAHCSSGSAGHAAPECARCVCPPAGGVCLAPGLQRSGRPCPSHSAGR